MGKLKLVFYLIATFSSHILTFGQNAVSDSLQQLLRNAPDKKKIDVYYTIITGLWLTNPDSALVYSHRSLDHSQKINDDRSKAIALRLYGGLLNYIGNYNEALFNLTEAYKLSVKVNDSTLIGLSLNNLGYLNLRMGYYPEAHEYLLRAINIQKTFPLQKNLSNILNNTGLLYLKLKDFTKAREFFMKALDGDKKINNYDGQVYSLNNLGFSYLYDANLSRAEWYFNQSLAIKQAEQTLNWRSVTYRGLGQLNIDKGQLIVARSFLSKSLKLSQLIHEKDGISAAYNLLAKLHLKGNNLDSALFFIRQGQRLGLEMGLRERRLEKFKLFEDYYTTKRKFDSALYFKSKYVILRDSMFNESMALTLTNSELKIKGDEAKVALAVKDSLIQKKTTQTYFLATIIVIVVTFIFILYRWHTRLEVAGKKVREQNQELQALNSTKDKFFSIISHDMKGPINSLTAFSRLLILHTGSFSKEEIQQLAMEFDKTLKNVFALLENLLEWSMSQTGNIDFTPELFDLTAILVQNEELLKEQAKNKNITIEFNCTEDRLMVNAHKHSITTVIRNLISNAIKFTHEGGKITVSNQKRKNEVVVSVMDNGVGMSPEVMTKLFNIDIKNSTKGTANENGTGLGLLLCKEFIEKNGGTIWVESKEGEGSHFYFKIPDGLA